MPEASRCPTPNDLRRFLLGQIADDETASVQDHLTTCATCLDRMADLSTDDSLVAAMQAQARNPAGADDGVVQALVDRLANVNAVDAEPAATLSWDGSHGRTEAVLPQVDGFEIQAVLWAKAAWGWSTKPCRLRWAVPWP
jgi:anti-sigma factor RsiW